MNFVTIFLLIGLAAYAQDTRTVLEPKIPPACVTLRAELTAQDSALAPEDESKPDTRRIQEAMDHCQPGQAVKLAADGAHDAFLTAPLHLRSGVTLLIDRGAILFGSRNPRDYDLQPGVCGTISERGHGCKAILNGDNVSDAAVMGDGVIDGRGGAKIMGQNISWWELAEQARKGGNQNNPRIMILSRCDNFTLYRIQLKDSPNFHVYYGKGNGFTAWGVIVNAPRNARNTDAFDPANSTNVTITHCFIHTGDDNVAIKAGQGGPTTRMSIVHNHFYSGHGMSIGSETDGGASAIRVGDLSIDGADNGLRIKSNNSRGGLVHDVEFDDVCIRGTKNPILMDSNYTATVGKDRDKIPVFTDIRLKNVRILDAGKITLDGYDQTHRLGIHFDGLSLDTTHADVVLGPGRANLHVSGDDVRVTGTEGREQRTLAKVSLSRFRRRSVPSVSSFAV